MEDSLRGAIQKKRIHTLYLKMIEYYRGDPHQVQHFVKVHSFARLIAQEEGARGELLELIEVAALVHDIGIKAAIAKYGKSSANLQEKLGPPETERLLCEIGFKASFIQRVCYLVGHHHTYDKIDGLDYQILVEADFLVNIHESGYDKDAIGQVDEKIFKTQTGKWILRQLFL